MVNMVHRRSVLRIRIRAKCLSYQATDKEMVLLTIQRQGDTLIAFVVYKRFQYPCFQVVEALDSPHAADKILTLVALYGTPLFFWKILNCIHAAPSSLLRSKRGGPFFWTPSHLCLRKVMDRLIKFDRKSRCFVLFIHWQGEAIPIAFKGLTKLPL